jgi:hypothetical protein
MLSSYSHILISKHPLFLLQTKQWGKHSPVKTVIKNIYWRNEDNFINHYPAILNGWLKNVCQ